MQNRRLSELHQRTYMYHLEECQVRLFLVTGRTTSAHIGWCVILPLSPTVSLLVSIDIRCQLSHSNCAKLKMKKEQQPGKVISFPVIGRIVLLSTVSIIQEQLKIFHFFVSKRK